MKNLTNPSNIRQLTICLMLLLSGSATAADTNYNLTGSWNNGSEKIAEYQGRLTIFINNRTRGPFLGWYTGENTLAVNFTDDGGCCTGNVTGGGEIIRWSNGTKWVRD